MPLAQNTMADLYDTLVPESGAPASGRIHPFVGQAFTTHSNAIRIMAIGINCYTGDTVTSSPCWFPAMFREQKYGFQRGVMREATRIASGLHSSGAFADRPFLGQASIYHTNAVKRWVATSLGKRAHRVPEPLFEEGAKVFRAELDQLAADAVLPHVVLVLGLRGWKHVWPAFGKLPPAWVSDYRTTPGELFHYLNTVTVREDGRDRPLLLVRVKHPTGGRSGLSALKLVAHAGFKAAVSQD